MPIHDRKEFLCEAIESVLNQTNPFWELIIVKTKGSPKEIDDILELYPLATILESETREIAEKLNIGIEHAKGEWIKYLASDDLLTRNCIEILTNECKDKTKYYYGYFYYINEFGIITEAIKSDSLVTSCFSKELFKQVGGFRKEAKYEDKDFIDRIPQDIKVQIPQFTGKYRVHQGQSANTPRYAWR